MVAGLSATRRAFLVATGVALSMVAGCAGREEADPTTSTPGTTSPPTETSATSADESDTDLDLREANVLDVTFESADEGVVRFDVTLRHDDDGEDGYADWWQVETLDGVQLGRRTLLHAHGTQPFTRSSNIDIPTDVTCVVVRGHDQTHGYGGQVLLVDLETGRTRPVGQGSEPEPFTAEACP